MSRVVIVAGGAGFLGSHLCEKLTFSGAEVHCIDNLYTGALCNLAACNLIFPSKEESDISEKDKNAKDNEAKNEKEEKRAIVYCYDIDVGTVDAVDKFLRLSGLKRADEVYNLACPASPIHYQHDPVFTWKTNVFGTYNLLELTKKLGARFLQASTSEVYGEPLKHPQKEELWTHLNTLGPRSCYDIGKAAAETLVKDYTSQYKLHASIVRIFNVYGPRMCITDGRIVSNFIVQALENKPLTIYGDGTQTRSFCYVDDMINGLQLVMAYSIPLIPCNLGNPEEISITNVANAVINATSLSSSFFSNCSNSYDNNSSDVDSSNSSISVLKEFLPSRIDDPTRRKPDITLAKISLDWKPLIDFKTGLSATIDYFKQQLEIKKLK